MTTIVSVRRNGHVVIGGDGQATMGNTVMKGNVRKVAAFIMIKLLRALQAVLLMHLHCLNFLNVN